MRTRFGKVLHVVALTIALGGAMAGPATAQSPLPIDPGENAKIRVTSLDSLNLVLEPADLGLYNSLFGAPIHPAEPPTGETDPERPLMDIKLHSVGGVMETWVDLRARFCDRNGWFNNATAVDNVALYAVSRATGYPKILADRIVLEEQGDTAFGQVTQLGEPLITLRWRKDDAAVAAALEAEPWRAHWLAGEGALYRGKSWTYEPVADVGPFVKEVQTEEVEGATQEWDSRVGMVEVTIDQSANPLLTNGNWMALAPVAVEVPGMLEHFRGAADFYGKSLQCGLEGSTIQEPPPGLRPPAAVR